MNIKFFSVLLILLISLNTKADTYNKYLKCWSSDQQFVVLAQWNDLAYIADRRMFDLLNYTIRRVPRSRWREGRGSR